MEAARQHDPGPLAWQASTLPVHQRGHLVGKASTCTACSTSLCYKSIIRKEETGVKVPIKN